MKQQYRKTKIAVGMCPSCGARPPVDGKSSCQICLDRAKRNAKLRRSNKGDDVKNAIRKWRKENPQSNSAIFKRHCNKLRETVFDHYGRICKCCGESFEFLTLDHINNDGNNHRNELFGDKQNRRGGGDAFYRWVIKNGYPDNLQPLCMNCNWAKYKYGVCPHETRIELEPEYII